jgi:hypothetical protein
MIRCKGHRKTIVDAEARQGYRLCGCSSQTEPRAFQKVSIDSESHTVAWPGGIDLCPDSLYEEVTGQPVLDRRVPSA